MKGGGAREQGGIGTSFLAHAQMRIISLLIEGISLNASHENFARKGRGLDSESHPGNFT